MNKRIVKYNPAFLSKEELVSSFVVRHAELELIVQVLRENVTKSNQHVLVVGPRGIGKTMLVLRVVEEIRSDKDLSKRWYPLVFSEESYPVTTPGEFWLEALFHLGEKTDEDCWKQTYHELGDEKDEERLRERALAQLMDFADAEGKRILLVVENFNILLGDQIDDGDAWKLRHTLLHEPRIMLLSTATSRFEEIDNADKAMFDMFRLYELGPLEDEDCGKLWKSITGKETSDEQVRPLQILTGGNPRLLAIISTFAAKMSLRELMDDLMQLVDDHTEYFKVHLDNLPVIERKIYLALAELWDPATARKVADFARLNVNKASSLLRRLIERGMVVEANGQGRAKLYQVSERMYNIYYLMRRRGAPSRRIKALVRFMVPFYGSKELVSLTRRITEEACGLEPELRKEHFWAYEGILEGMEKGLLRDKLIEITPCDFFKMPDMPTSLKGIAGNRLVNLLNKADILCKKSDKLEEAEQLYKEAIEMDPESGEAWASFGAFLQWQRGRYEEAEKAYRKAIDLKPDYAWVWANFGSLLHENLGKYEEAENAYRKAIDLQSDFHWAWEQFGRFLHRKVKRYDEAEKAYWKAINVGPDCFLVWVYLGELLHEHLNRDAEAEEAYRKAIDLKPDYARGWANLGQLLHKLGRYEEAKRTYRKAIEIDKKNAYAWAHLGQLLHMELGRPEEAEKAYRKAIEIDPMYPCPWVYLGDLLRERGCYEEAEKAYRKAVKEGVDCGYAWYSFGSLLDDIVGNYEEAEVAYRKAIEIEPRVVLSLINLVFLLHDKLKRPNEALELVSKYLEKSGLEEQNVIDTIELFVGLAAAGYGREALKILVGVPSVEILEPLVVGLRMYLGEDVKAAAEIMEVGKDVVKRIEQLKREMRKKKKAVRKKKRQNN